MDIATGKRCAMCFEVKMLSEFSIRSQRGRKYPLAYCKPCKAKREIEIRNSDLNAYNTYKRSYYRKNRSVILRKAMIARTENPSYFNERTRKWKESNKILVSKYRKRYVENNREKFAFYNSQRRAIKIMASPRWANRDEIKKIYKNALILGMQVDHIVPLKSKIVCGLHVENNLQLLSSTENRSKFNRFWPDMP